MVTPKRLDPDLEPAPAVTPSEIGFRLTILEDGARAISGNPYEKVYSEIEALRKAGLEAEQQNQEQVDGLAESTPDDLTEYPEREA